MYFPYVQQRTGRQHRVITVTGIGNISVEPTIVQIQLEVSTENEQLSQAQLENASVMNRVIESLLELGINRENIKTTFYTIVPQYDFIEGRQVFRGYEVTNAITVEITNIEQAGNVIDVAVQNGVNRVTNIQFTVGNEQVYYQEALNLALKNAQDKADTIAKSMHLQLAPQPITIIEKTEEKPIVYRTFAAREVSATTPIEQGQITITATVRVQFQY